MSRHTPSKPESRSHDSAPSAPLTTPRKRQIVAYVGEGLLTPPDSHHKRSTREQDPQVGTSAAKRRRVTAPPNVPSPNPPTAPFPTPRKIILRLGSQPPAPPRDETPPPTPRNGNAVSLTSKTTDLEQAALKTPWKRADVLPPHLASLLALHQSFDLALSLHIATHPPVLPPPPPPPSARATTYGIEPMDVRLEALTNYVALRPIVEKSCGKRFGLSELKRLMWLWQDTSQSSTSLALSSSEENPFLDTRGPNPTACYTVTPTRTIDATTSRRVHTYGFGLEIQLTPREAASYVNTLHGEGEACGGAGKAVGAVARWSAGSEARCRAIEERLWAWVKQHAVQDDHDDPLDSKIPHIPCAALPQLQPAIGSLLPPLGIPISAPPSPSSSRLGRSSPLVSSGENRGGLLPPPAFRSTGSSVGQRLQAVAGTAPGLKRPAGAAEEDVFGPVMMIPKETKAAPAGSAEERQRALFERIKARSGKEAPGLSRPLLKSGQTTTQGMSRSQMQDELKRRSTLSRLEGVAEAVWMFFSLSPSNTASLASPGSSPRAKRRAFPVSDVIDIVVKSSKTPISGPEAYDSLVLLTQLCPSFLILRTIARQEWLEMPSAAHQINASPGAKISLAGPASPGKVVVRGGGGSLREVRERIRKELGDL
ncbi:hypothetical protein NliqN6_2375 [Naganishia liquefaciens]|uniref:DNA replication factor Cdt1 C-terminal domain-containing protein n=1 Tax=Naganishia liquefaciens TaxID=104408 RepID=A0A8H3YE76_9TREE|nr:hypothetical protein NliqN6_2375 [Naganishia liquefaciens]